MQLDGPTVIARNDNAKFQLTLTNREESAVILGGDGFGMEDLFHLEILSKRCTVLHYGFKRSLASLMVLATLKPHDKTVLTASWTPANSSDNNVYPGTHWAIGRVGAGVMPNGSATTNKDVLWDWKEILVVP
ncbi:MAG: hypothetical protein NTZ05_02360 [Chloroflexi bacterium]|nr:hypothetical protein [Chloroflexota bacterium]